MTDKAASTAVARTIDVPALIAGLMTVTVWGSAFVAIRAVGHALSPGALALGRLVVSTAILGAIALVRREPLPPRRDLLPIAVYGIVWLGVYSTALNAAERLVDAGTAAMIINIGPLLIALAAGLFLREGFPPGLFAGSAIAFTGCVVIGVATIHSGTHSALGIALCLVAVLAYAAAVVVQKPVLTRVSPFQVTWLGCVACTIVCLPFAPTLVTDAAKAAMAGHSRRGTLPCWRLYRPLTSRLRKAYGVTVLRPRSARSSSFFGSAASATPPGWDRAVWARSRRRWCSRDLSSAMRRPHDRARGAPSPRRP
jgi:drug/metabolite transporter (DMT)-like permease